MSRRDFAAPAALAIVTGVLSLAPTAVAGQGASAPPQAAKAWTLPRTPAGQPDLQGYWTNDTFTPLERPPELAGKELFTEEEAAAYLKKRLDQYLAQSKDDIHYDDAIWQGENYAKEPNRRTSLIIDPRDGLIPPLTPEAEKRAAARAEASRSSGRRRQRAEPHVGRTVHFMGHRGTPDASADVQRQSADSANPGLCGHSPRDDSRGSHHPSGRTPARRTEHPPAGRRFARSLGRRHAGRRHDQLHRQDQFQRGPAEHSTGHLGQRRVACRRTLHSRGCGQDPLRIHGRRPRDAGRPGPPPAPPPTPSRSNRGAARRRRCGCRSPDRSRPRSRSWRC